MMNLHSAADAGAPRAPSGPRLRIAVLNRVFSATGGGAERYSIALVEQLAERHDIHVFAQRIDHHWPGVTYHSVSMPMTKSGWINQLWYATMTWWLTRKGFDIVHSHENTWHGQIQTAHVLPVKYNLLAGRNGWRLLLGWLKVLASPRLSAYVWLEHLRYAPQQRQRSVIATSPSLADVIAQSFPGALALLNVVTPGVDKVGGPPTRNEQLAARVRLGLPPSGRCILLVGNDYRKKGLGTLVDALPDLPATTFVAVVGNPAQKYTFREQAKALGVESRVHFLGSRKDLGEAYRAADCLAHPTLEDTFAMVVLEAMAHGIPVIVSQERYCGIAGLLEDGQNALILQNPMDHHELAIKLHRVLEEKSLRERMILQSLSFARSHQWKGIAERQEAIYMALRPRRSV
jgi:UDP-glucose:(heptosyl)LPS alpha-1,3-glucosyltransferase